MGQQRSEIEAQGWQLVIVHMGEQVDDLPGLVEHSLSDTPTVADPNCELYRSFGLVKGGLGQHFHPRLLKKGFQASKAGHKVSGIQGDGWQLPGMFLVKDGEIIEAHRGEHAADHGDPAELIAAAIHL